jgi:CRP-like cAMP-binding protein
MGYVQEQTSNRQATVETTADTLVAELPREYLDALSLSCQLKFNRALLRALADRLALANVRVSAPVAARVKSEGPSLSDR